MTESVKGGRQKQESRNPGTFHIFVTDVDSGISEILHTYTPWPYDVLKIQMSQQGSGQG